MASTEAADSRLARVVIPSLEKIIKNASWRKHSKLAHECKSLILRLRSPDDSSPLADSDSGSSLPGPLHDGASAEYSLAESEIILSPLINASSTGVLKIVDPALDCLQKLIAHGYLRGEADPTGAPDALLLSKLIETICKCHELDDEALELLLLKTLLTAVTSISLRIHGDSLLQIVRTCYGIYLGSRNAVNQATAKASLVQMSVIVFRRMEADSSTVPIQPIVVAELMEPTGRSSESDPSTTQSVQGFITKIMQDIDGVFNSSANSKGTFGAHDGAFETSLPGTANPTDLLDSTDKDMLDAKYWEISMYKSALEGRKGELADGEVEKDDDSEVQIGNKLRRDAFLVFRALCKLSMKTPPKEDPELMRGKIVALELLKILLENAGAVFRTSDRFLGAIKQYLCLSLLKNSASNLMIIFQLSCSILLSLVSRFRAGLKAEIGVFFPMIVLRVLENVAQPDFQQKMIVLRFLEKLCVDSQILVDIFINYDCDVNSSNIFERMVNGLLKTAQGVPPGMVTTLLPPQETAMKLEALKCLVAVLRSMGDWVNKQLRLPDPYSAKMLEIDDRNLEEGGHPVENGKGDGGHGGFERSESQSELSSGTSDALAIEQRRAYKLELQEGISIFNQKPKKGIEFLIKANKVGDSPEEIAAFLKDASGLNKTLVGDYLGEREDLSLKVMHAYVDSFDFQGMEFDEAIRAFLRGFRLPGEAQKIDRIMEKFAERYCKCNPKAFSSADTAYVLAYSVILLNTDAHNPMVKSKMTADGFIRNNRGIDDGKDLPEEYLRALYERISRNEIKMKDDGLGPQQKQPANSSRLLGLDTILNIVVPRRGDDLYMETSDDLIRHMQERFKEKARKSESVYYAASDVVILRFMVEVCWAPMLAAFSVPLDQSDDAVITTLCLEGFHNNKTKNKRFELCSNKTKMLAIFQKAFAHPPEELNSPASHSSGKSPKLPGETLSDFLSLHKDTAFSMTFGDSAVLAYSRPQSSLRQRLFCGIDGIYCTFLGALTNLCTLNRQYGLTGKNTSEAMFVIEAYRTLRDRGPYPADQVLRGLEGSFAFVVYDTQTSSVFSALSSDGGESLYWGISGDGSVVMSDDVKIIKQGCAKSFAPFPTGCMFHSETGLKSFEHPRNEMKAMPRIDSEGVLCGANFKVDACSKVNGIPRRGSEANWALANSR